MAGRGPSRQELIRRRRSSTFIGRHGEGAAFRDALKQSPDEAPQFLFHVRGPAGVGKSTLVRQLETVAREGQAVTAYVDESVADVVETMEVISAQFAQQGVALKGFDKLLATYRQRRHEADAGMATAAAGADAAAGGSPAPSPSSVIASQLGLVGLGMLPGVGAFTGAVDPNQVAAGADRVKALLSTRLRSHGDVELVLSPLDALTPVFLEELGEVARKHPWIVLFFDTYERTGPMLDTWLRDVLGSDRYGELPANVLVTLAGQSRLAARCWEDWHDLVTDWPLEVFTDAEARRLLTGKGVTDERVEVSRASPWKGTRRGWRTSPADSNSIRTTGPPWPDGAARTGPSAGMTRRSPTWPRRPTSIAAMPGRITRRPSCCTPWGIRTGTGTWPVCLSSPPTGHPPRVVLPPTSATSFSPTACGLAGSKPDSTSPSSWPRSRPLGRCTSCSSPCAA
ncbi:ATP-binding protein [Streptomyces sp. NBC_01343]|uniref:ATP-binding protein n=1 Tax=Streptomyces sp. NBC_01343 TaxID=2903832 RepID=UPI002E119460|nr:ATP-binding protein [Streptomyces sp. NBC_01343]